MQDRFKFRAWNKLSNEMKDVISLNINYEFPECSNVILETNTFDNIKTHNNSITCANGLNNVVLMQCTGLKDKNGKLIYEGDIVKEYYYNAKETAIKKIIFDENICGYAYMDGIEYNSLCFSDCRRLEVIGNIYENKELLNE